MKKIFILIFATTILVSCASKKQLNQLRFDEKANKDILYGNCDLNGLKKEPFIEWYKLENQDYQPNYELLSNIESTGGLSDVNITIVMATWCSDSWREVPRFFKLFENLDYNSESIKIINVDTEKKASGTKVSKLNIESVPTFIFFRNGNEIGRIIESPEESLEADMLKIIGG